MTAITMSGFTFGALTEAQFVAAISIALDGVVYPNRVVPVMPYSRGQSRTARKVHWKAIEAIAKRGLCEMSAYGAAVRA